MKDVRVFWTENIWFLHEYALRLYRLVFGLTALNSLTRYIYFWDTLKSDNMSKEAGAELGQAQYQIG